ncbi:MAG: hypothetical protein AB7K52_06085 [Phycisphaerales bacterium]
MNASAIWIVSAALSLTGAAVPTAHAQCCAGSKPVAHASMPFHAGSAADGNVALAAAPDIAEPVNKLCPIKGGEVDTDSPTRQFQGVTVGFCCPGCEGKWDKKTDDEKMALLAKSAPEAVAVVKASAKSAEATAGAPAQPDAATLAKQVARSYIAACSKADVAALNALFLDKGRATVSENAGDEGTWETYRDHHLLPELKEMPGFVMTVTKEDVQTFGTTSIVRQIGAFTVPDPNHPDAPRKYLAAVTYVVVDDGGTPRIAHLHWSSRAEKRPETKAQTDGTTVNDICPMTGDKVNPFHSREYNGLKVGFCDGDCALRWDALTEEVRAKRLADAIAGTTPKTPHGAQPGHDHGHGDHDHE